MPYSKGNKDCYLCSQIKGDADHDLIAKMLPDYPYRRRVILENDSFAVIPSLGALTEGHVLLCPKTHVHSFAQLGRQSDKDVSARYLQIKNSLIKILEHHYGAPIFLFEHGMSANGGHTPCSIDHAHLHFIPMTAPIKLDGLSADFIQVKLTSLKSLAEASHEQEYLLCEFPDGTSHIATGLTSSFPSQGLRRLFAESLGNKDRWNWRNSPHPEIADSIWQKLVNTTNRDHDRVSAAAVDLKTH